MIVPIIVSAILLVFGVLILIGKGDNLIAGYNTASEKEKAKYNIKRLRGLIGGFLILLAPQLLLTLGKETVTAVGIFVSLTLVLCFLVIILANTWAKKR